MVLAFLLAAPAAPMLQHHGVTGKGGGSAYCNKLADFGGQAEGTLCPKLGRAAVRAEGQTPSLAPLARAEGRGCTLCPSSLALWPAADPPSAPPSAGHPLLSRSGRPDRPIALLARKPLRGSVQLLPLHNRWGEIVASTLSSQKHLRKKTWKLHVFGPFRPRPPLRPL